MEHTTKPLSERALAKAVQKYINKKGWKKKLDPDLVDSLQTLVVYMFKHPEKGDFDFDKYISPEFDDGEIYILCRGSINKIDMLPYVRRNCYKYKQLLEILLGKEQGFDVSIYDDPRFDCGQMLEIRMGLMEGLDVSMYAKLDYYEAQMGNIRYCLENGLDASKICNPKLFASEMCEIIDAMEKEKEKENEKMGIKKEEKTYYIAFADGTRRMVRM